MSRTGGRRHGYCLHNLSIRGSLRSGFFHMIEGTQLIIGKQSDSERDQLLRSLIQFAILKANAGELMIRFCHFRHALLQIQNFILVSRDLVIGHFHKPKAPLPQKFDARLSCPTCSRSMPTLRSGLLLVPFKLVAVTAIQFNDPPISAAYNDLLRVPGYNKAYNIIGLQAVPYNPDQLAGEPHSSSLSSLIITIPLHKLCAKDLNEII